MRSAELSALRKPQRLVENRVSFAGPEAELSIYDTYQAASRVGLDADQLLYCGMIQGRKIMHDAHHPREQIFLPHESFVMAPGEHVDIDFPDATTQSPTTCLTIEISKEKVAKISERLSDLNPIESGLEGWQHSSTILHTHHTTATQHLLTRLVSCFTENHPDRDVLVDLGVSELIIRMLRHQERELLLSYCRDEPNSSGITAALNHLEKHLAEPLDIDQLSRVACMSRSRLYAEFKTQIGCSPSELQQQLRLKLASRRLRRGEPVTRVCYDLGFNNPSHFSRRFRDFFGCSPREYHKRGVAGMQ
ncbi:AraC family transcriptional regulator [Sedimenticola hydrogenitrophicus]|uniref:AraC family transcriptional regulator n=1 Tax=Sedimenticola hydrogenitrophicus TaxID=2967975 RepID=UPI0021A5A49F|nr:AraC family transcriptional regulator [Sedimenticola hydrogenitrophicus]